MSILHSEMSSDQMRTQTNGLQSDTVTSAQYSSDSEDSLDPTKLSSEEVEKETKQLESKVSDALFLVPCIQPCSVISHHPPRYDLASLSPTMQVPSEPAGGESDPHEEPESAAVKGEC